MTLVDVQGKSLFQTGGNSPYSVFLYYPYPLFELTLKGFYGKAIKYELMLLNFQHIICNKFPYIYQVLSKKIKDLQAKEVDFADSDDENSYFIIESK